MYTLLEHYRTWTICLWLANMGIYYMCPYITVCSDAPARYCASLKWYNLHYYSTVLITSCRCDTYTFQQRLYNSKSVFDINISLLWKKAIFPNSIMFVIYLLHCLPHVSLFPTWHNDVIYSNLFHPILTFISQIATPVLLSICFLPLISAGRTFTERIPGHSQKK